MVLVISKKDIGMLFAYYPARWIVRSLPYYMADRLAIIMGNIQYLLPGHMKKLTERNMSKVMGKSMSAREIKRAVRHNLISRCRSLFDQFFLDKINAETLSFYVKHIEGQEHLDRALSLGRGAIIVTAHFGSMMLITRTLSLLGYDMAHISSRVDPSIFEMQNKRLARKVFNIWNRQVEGKFQSKKIGYAPGEAFKASQEFLREGKLLGVAIDGSLARKTVSVPFMGQSLRLPSGTAALSVRTGAPFVPTFFTFQPNGERKLYLLPPIIPPADMKEEEAVRSVVAEFAQVMEQYIRKYPDHWFTWVRLETEAIQNGQFEMWAKPFDNAAGLFAF